jgi:hypothetical protein
MGVFPFRFRRLVAESVVMLAIGATVPAPNRESVRRRSALQRMDLKRLQAAAAARQRFAAERRLLPATPGLRDFRAIFHVHAEDSRHTGGTREEVLEACRRTGVRVVFLTNHAWPERDSFKHSWRGLRDGVLFFSGEETEGLLSFPAAPSSHPAANRDQHVAELLRGRGLVFLSHLEDRLQHSPAGLTGYELYNAHAEVKDELATGLALLGSLCDTKRWPVLADKVKRYGDEWMGALQAYPQLYLRKWDRDCERQQLTGIAANDAHHNQVFRVVVRDEFSVSIISIEGQNLLTLWVTRQPELGPLLKGRKRGDVLFQLDLDPYERSFRSTNTHIMASELSEPVIREAVRRGRAYIAHEWLADATGFALIAKDGDRVYEMGDSVELRPGLRLETRAPLDGWFQVIRNGQRLAKVKGASHSFSVHAPGVYRVEVWLEVDGEERPWIYSNPIWVGTQGARSKPIGTLTGLPALPTCKVLRLLTTILLRYALLQTSWCFAAETETLGAWRQHLENM